MDRNSLLTVAIFMLAHTLGVSQSAATGHQPLILSVGDEAIVGGSRPNDDTDLVGRPVGFSPSASSSVESPVQEWMEDENDDPDDEDEWVPLLSPGKFRYETLRGTRVRGGGPREQQHLEPKIYTNSRLIFPDGYYSNDGGAGLGGGLIKKGNKLKRVFMTTKLGEEEQRPESSARTMDYRIPSDSNMITGNFEKRSPRCIANCMRQGLVHPVQCHSLCRRR